ncbi:phage tail protein [Citrobacter freundii]|uniref:phage tail protein n=3 Tax=Citrobacter freundii complex TaxID=1344959 RepID=UPI00081A6E3E|nr:phage tail protein [Citrobacter freundii]ANZ86019.1 phage tail fiber protein [Citrobacter freundii]
MADYYSIITNRGKELEAEALASGRLIVLTHFVVGDSNGKQVKPDPAQVRLNNETYRGDIAELVVSPEQSTQLMAKIVLPTGVGGFTVREVGLMTDAGELYAVANCPSIDKPVGGVSVNMQFRLAVSDTSNITLNVATGDGLFLRIDQNLKEIKARGAEAQKTSRESIGVLDGTTQQRGLVQLNSAVNSTSETQAATPAAVKIVMDNANARLAKDRNGADIPNVALFLQNLGLVETINRAAGSLQKDQNLNDISDKVQARNALQLGTAATLDATTSRNDNTLGRVLKVGDRNLGVTVIPASRGFNFNSYEFAAGETLFIEVNAAINFPAGMPEFANTFVYVNVIGIRDSGNDCALLLSRYDTNISYLAWRIHEANTSINWRVLKIPTAAADIGAIPKDPIGTIGINGRMASADTPGWWLVSVDNADTVADFPKYPNGNSLYSYGFMFVARSGSVWLQQYFSHTGASASRQTWNGDMSERTPWIIDYSTANKPTASDVGALPITGGGLNGNLGIGTTNALGGNSIVLGDNDTGFKQNGDGILDVYANSVHVFRFLPGSIESGVPLKVSGIEVATQAWVLQNFVQNIDLTAPAEVGFWDGRGYPRGTDGAAMYNFNMVGGSSNVGNFIVRYTRKQVNNTWYVIN